MTFVHLAIKSDLSFLTGACTVQRYAQRAKELGAPALAITELGSMRSAFELHEACKDAGIKPIFGVEVYVCRDAKSRGIPKAESDEIKATLPVESWAQALDDHAHEHGYMQSERELTTLRLWAKDSEGLAQLFELTSRAWVDGFFYKPRTDLDAILSLGGEHIYVGTAGVNSAVNRPMLEGRRREALDVFDRLAMVFGRNLLVEIQPHMIMDQCKANSFALDLLSRSNMRCDTCSIARECGCECDNGIPRIVATNDTHYLNAGDLDSQRMMSAIGNKRKRDRDAPPDVESFGLPVDSFFYRTSDEMREAFELVSSQCNLDELTIKLALANTLEVASEISAELTLDPFACIVPDLESEYETPSEELQARCSELGRRALLPWGAEYEERLARELVALRTCGFESYLLYIAELVNMARELGIAVGPGRGSGAGSLVCYLLNITDVDPVAHDLLFERFVAPGRVSPPDIDVDLDSSKRPLLIEAMRERWGAGRVSNLATFGRLTAAAVVNDVCRELRVPISRTLELTAILGQVKRSPSDPRKHMIVLDTLVGSDEDEAHPIGVKFHEDFPDVLGYAAKLEGMARHAATHASGIVVAPKPLWSYMPVETRASKDGDGRDMIAAWAMVGVEQAGLLKADMLGLETVSVLSSALDAVNARFDDAEVIAKWHGGRAPDGTAKSDRDKVNLWDAMGVTVGEYASWAGDPDFKLTFTNIPRDDRPTLDTFTAGDFAAVFQFDTASNKRLCADGVTFTGLGTIAAITAVNRPGPLGSGQADVFVKRTRTGKYKATYHPAIEAVVSDTFGVIVYQEQVMKIFALAGWENPDEARKIIGKRKGAEALEALRPRFVPGCVENIEGMTELEANKLLDNLVSFGSYSFNKSHSLAYGLLGYLCQYLKIHHPLEFWCSVVRSQQKDEKRRALARDAQSRGIAILPPNVNTSGLELATDRKANAIVGALTEIKGVGLKAAQAIVDSQPFANLDDFMDRTPRRPVTMGVIRALAQAGALDDLVSHLRWYLENIEDLFKRSKTKTKWLGTWEAELEAGSSERCAVCKNCEGCAALAESAEEFVECDGCQRCGCSFGGPDYTSSERLILRSEINPMSLENPYQEFLDTLPVKIVDHTDPDFFAEHNGRGVWVSGQVTDIRPYQNLPYERDPTDQERNHEGFGLPECKLMLAGDSGGSSQLRIKWHVHRELERAPETGDHVLALVTPRSKYRDMIARVAVSLPKLKAGSAQPLGSMLASDQHPALSLELGARDRKYATASAKRMTDQLMDKSADAALLVGIVTDLRTLITKKGDTMAKLGLYTPSRDYFEISIFPRDLARHAKKIARGNVIAIEIEGELFRGEPNFKFVGGDLRRLSGS